MAEGWIKLHRKFLEHPFWKEKRVYSRAEAWEDILLNANYKDKQEMIKGQLIDYKRGEWHTSELKLCDRWKWSRNKVRLYLSTLVVQKMIGQKGTPNGTTLTVINYDLYQCESTTESTPDGTPEGTPEGTQTKKEKKDKKDKKNIYSENVQLSDSEYQNLNQKYGAAKTQQAIQYLSNYKIEKAYKTKSDYHTLIRWVFEAVSKNKNTNIPKAFQSLMGEDDYIDITGN